MTQIDPSELFELDIALPDQQIARTAEHLIGFDERFQRVGRSLQTLLDPDSVRQWAARFHAEHAVVADVLGERYPLVVLAGDVGTGKTAFAEAAADRLTRVTRRDGHLFKLSTRVRGTGHVGQMSHLINQAFAVVEREAGRERLAFLIIDEADSLAASREGDRSHHEDKVAVNTVIQRVDDVRRLDGRMLVFLCTNRPQALDPALMRRAGHNETFERPDNAQRLALLEHDTAGLGISPQAIAQAVELTGPEHHGGVGFTFSDLRTRLLAEVVLRAYPDRPIVDDDLLAVAAAMTPSPALVETRMA